VSESNTTVYAAIELSNKNRVVDIAHPNRDRPSIHRIAGGNLVKLIGRLRKAAGQQRRSYSPQLRSPASEPSFGAQLRSPASEPSFGAQLRSPASERLLHRLVMRASLLAAGLNRTTKVPRRRRAQPRPEQSSGRLNPRGLQRSPITRNPLDSLEIEMVITLMFHEDG